MISRLNLSHSESFTDTKSKVTLEASAFTQEKFQLFCDYQAHVHADYDKSPEGFARFLVSSPLFVSSALFRIAERLTESIAFRASPSLYGGLL